MSATFSRVKTWIAEKLTASDLNAEINNILDNFDPAGMGGSSSNEVAMQVQTDPGEPGSAVLATSLAGEIERLRYEIAQIKGETYWYSAQATSLATINSTLGQVGIPTTRIISGQSVTGSSQSFLLTPEGAGNGNNFTINATATNIIFSVAGIEYTKITDTVVAFTLSAPVTNNTALINDAALADGNATLYLGMGDFGIPIDAVGSEITSLNGQFAAFRLDTAAGSEYLWAKVNTTDGYLENVRRGWFFDETGAGVRPIVFADNDTLTLMNTQWVFLKTDLSYTNTYNEPIISATEPPSAASSDHWFDTVNQIWKRFDGSVFSDAEALFLGVTLQDENGDCVAARSEDIFASHSETNTLVTEYGSTTTVIARPFSTIVVNGVELSFLHDNPVWDIAADLDTGITEAASTRYYLYMTEAGVPVMSDVPPIDLLTERKAFYHPHQTWRAVGFVDNDGSSDLDSVALDNYLPYAAQTERSVTVGPATNLFSRVGTAGLVEITELTTQCYLKKGAVLIHLLPSNDAVVTSKFSITNNTSSAIRQSTITLKRNGISISAQVLNLGTATAGTGVSLTVPSSVLTFYDNPGPGKHTYALFENTSTTTDIEIFKAQLVIVEI